MVEPSGQGVVFKVLLLAVVARWSAEVVPADRLVGNASSQTFDVGS
jgi:hypothetical protein